MGKYLQLHNCGPWVPKQQGSVKGDLWVPNVEPGNEDRHACSMYRYVHMLPEPGIMYTYIRNNGTRNLVYISNYVHTDEGWTVTSRTIFGGVSQFTIFTGFKCGTDCSTLRFFAKVHPASPLLLRYMIKGESSLCPWPTGTYVLK